MLRRFEEFSYVISSIYHSIQKIERDEMEKYGLKGPYAQYLVAMSHWPEGITAARLAQLCDRDKAAVSRALGEMVQQGLLIREGGTTAYRALLKLTEKGEEAARFVAQRAKMAVELAGKGLSDQDRAFFYCALRGIAATLTEIGKDGLPEAT